MNIYMEYKLKNKRFDVLNYLKGFSIITIVIMHLLPFIGGIPSKIITLSAIGGTGVHVFFLCSGIGLYLSYLNTRVNYIEFIKKRWIKIYIPYIIIVFISFLSPWMYSDNDRVAAFLSHIFMYKMFIPKYEESFGVQFWYVSTIIQLYFIFIPMCKIKEKLNNNKIFLIIFLGISIVWWNLCYMLGVSNIRVWSSFCFQYIWEFALGMVIADKLVCGKIYRSNLLNLALIATLGMALQAGLAIFSENLKLFNDIPALFGYSALALLLMNINTIKKICNEISKISYELFLIHIYIFKTLFLLFNSNKFIIQCMLGIVAVVISIICAYFYSKFINKYVTLINNGLNIIKLKNI